MGSREPALARGRIPTSRALDRSTQVGQSVFVPEGDTIAAVARRMRRDLAGSTLERLYVRRHGEIDLVAGARIETIASHGKELVVEFTPRTSLRVHLGLRGFWRRHPPAVDLSALESPHVLLANPRCSYVCFRPARCDLVRSGDRRLGGHLQRLGPDLLADDIDLESVGARARAGAGDRTIAEVLLDQRIAAGIGNVYKSEALFIARIDPNTTVADLDDERLGALYHTARELMMRNVGTRRRSTPIPNGPRLWVYRRYRGPCRRCHTPIVRAYLGTPARSTYWCPRCQPSPGDRVR